MITKKQIAKLVKEKLSDDQFIVDLSVSNSNVIQVTVDGMDGIKISQCVEISRNIEKNLDRDAEDFELQVLSAGLGLPFKVHEQFIKNQDQDIEVITDEGIKLKGIMKNVNEEGFDLEVTTKEKVEGKKKKELVCRVHHFEFDKIKEAKNIIKF